MTKSSKPRKARARAKKRMAKEAAHAGAHSTKDNKTGLPQLTTTDKRYLIGFTVLSMVITAFYWWLGGRNLLVFPAILCISVVKFVKFVKFGAYRSGSKRGTAKSNVDHDSINVERHK